MGEAPFLQKAVPSDDERMIWTITQGAFGQLYLYLFILQLHSPFKDEYMYCTVLRNPGNAFQEAGVF